MRRSIAAVGVLVAVAASAPIALPSPAAAANTNCVPTPPPSQDQAQLQVTWPGGSKTFTACDIARDNLNQSQTSFAVCSNVPCIDGPGGTLSYSVQAPGVKLNDLLGELGANISPHSIRSVTMTAGGETLMMDGSVFDDSNDPAFPFLPVANEYVLPYVYANNSTEITFLRPQYPTPAIAGEPYSDDPNGDSANNLDATSSGVMTMALDIPGVVLHPTIQGPTSVMVGTSASFTAMVSPKPGDPLTYQWHFSDTPTEAPTTTMVAHRYTAEGNFTVSVTARDTRTGDLGTDEITVNVKGKPIPTPTGSHSTPGNGTATHSNPAVGPLSGTGLHVGGGLTSASEGPTASIHPVASNAPVQSSAAVTSTQAVQPNAPGYLNVQGVLLAGAGGAVAPPAQQSPGHVGAAPAERAGTTTTKTITFGLSLGVAVFALLVLGAYSEWRRPGRGPKRRA